MNAKRFLSALLALVMVLALLPTGFAQADSEIEIANYEQLKAFAARVNAGEYGLNAKITSDFTCSTATDWTPICPDGDHPYIGTFDGGKHVITGLKYHDLIATDEGDPADFYAGLFGVIGAGGTVRDLYLRDCSMEAGVWETTGVDFDLYLGAIAGRNYGTVTNCCVFGTSKVKASSYVENVFAYVGGIAGHNCGDGTVTNCCHLGEITVAASEKNNSTSAGGIAGYSSGQSIENCFHTGSVSAEASGIVCVGGVVGDNSAKLINCRHTGSVEGNDAWEIFIGGVAGENAPLGTVSNCYARGAVSSTGVIGFLHLAGVVGGNYGENGVSDCCYDTTLLPDAQPVNNINDGSWSDVVGLASEAFADAGNFSDWENFGANWVMGVDQPEVKALSAEVHLYANSNEDLVLQRFICAYVPTAFANPFTYADHEFTGWNTDPDGNGDPIDETHAFTLLPGETLTLYAQWRDAVVRYPLWVGGVQVTEENKDNILNDDTDSVRFRIEDGKYFLTLDNADISTYSAHDVQWWRRTANIFFNEPNINLTVELIGDNTLSGAEGGIVFVPLDSSGVVTLTGEGSLSIDGSNFDVYGFGILHIDDTTLIAGKEAEQNTGSGLYARGIEIDGSSVQAYGKYYAIMTENPGFTVTDSCVVAKGEGNGVDINGPITIGGDSILIAEGSAEEGALRVYRDVTLNDGIALVEPENAGYVSASGGGRCVANPDGSKATRAVYAIPYPLYVGGVHVTSANADDVMNDGTVKFEITDEGENVLTLTNATVTGVYEEAITERTYNVYSGDTGFALTVKPIGENSLSGAKDAISLAGVLQLTGDGTLTAEASNAGISVRYGITVDGPTVKAGGIAYGVWTGGGTLSVKGTSKLTAEATGGMAIFAKTIDIDEGLSITTPTGARVGGYGEAETVYDSNIAVATMVVIEPGYLITFRNEDGTELQSYPVAAGETPIYEGETPVKAPTVEKLYTFAGWKLSGTETVLTELPTVDGEATYIAAYTESDRVYTGPVWAWTGYTKAEATFTAADDATFTQTVTATGDAIVNAVTTEPTCTEKGERTYTATVTFLGAQYSDKAYEPVDETGHDWAEPTYTWEAIPGGYTCTATRVCKNDAAHTESETVGSTYAVIEEAKPYVDGLGRYTSAAFANEAFAVQTMDEAIPMLHVTYACDAVNALDACLYENGEWLYRVDVRVTNLPDGALDIDSAQLFLTYDHELLALRRTEGMVDWIILDRGDMLSAVWASDADVSVKDGDAVLTLYFALAREANADEIAALAFTQSERGVCAMSYVNDGVVTELNADTINGGILFETPIYGDANGDGMVTAADAALILRAIVGLNTLTTRGMFNGDADGDGEITAADAALILRFVVGLIDRLPVQ